MYLSRVALDSSRRETMQLLASPYLMHGAVERSFSGERERNLWRLDWLQDTCYLLILSKQRPHLLNIAQKYGDLSSLLPFETKEYAPFIDRLQSGQNWRFRLCANPVRSSFAEKENYSARGKVFAHVTPEQQKKWLLSRAEKNGFALSETSFEVVQSEWKRFKKGNHSNSKISLHTVTYEGLLTIVDTDLFTNALVRGIGRAKAYGCGFLTVAHAGRI